MSVKYPLLTPEQAWKSGGVPASVPRYIIPDLPSADELMPFLRRMDANRWYSNFGPLVTEFEHTFCATMAQCHGIAQKSIHAFAASTGYHALVIGLTLLGIGPGKKVLVPTLTFPACAHAVEHVGAETILCDVDAEHWTLTPEIAQEVAARHKIDAVMPVAVYGIPVPAAAWDEFTERTGIPVLIDAAAAVESQHYLRHGLVVHSLHASKPFGIGEGGLLVSARQQDIAAAREYANFGTYDRITHDFGENAKLSEFHAAVGLAQLKRWPLVKQRRAKLYDQFKHQAEKLGTSCKLHPGLVNAVVSCLMFQTQEPVAQSIIQQLRDKTIFAHHTYLPPLHKHPYFANTPLATATGQMLRHTTKVRQLPVADALAERIFGLPFHHELSPEAVTSSMTALTEILTSLNRR